MVGVRAVLRREFSRSKTSVAILGLVGLIVVGLTLATSGYIPAPAAGRTPGQVLYPVVVHGFLGYVDRAGEMVVKPQYTMGSPFSEGLASVNTGDPSEGKYGYIDTSGKMVIGPEFTWAGDFSEGLAVVSRQYDWRSCVYIDRTGAVAITGPFSQASDFDNGLAAVSITPKSPDGSRVADLWGVIDTSGRYVVPPIYQFVDTFREGLAAVQVDDGTFGYIDTSGRMAIAPQFKDVRQFTNGLAVASKGDRYGMIDINGTWVIPPGFKDLMPFQGGLATAQADDGTWGYVDMSGTWPSMAAYDYAGAPDGYGLRRMKQDGLWGIMDRAGQWVVTPQYGDIWDFTEGLAAVAMPGAAPDTWGPYGFIDTTGKLVIPAQFRQVWWFRDGLAGVTRMDGTEDIIDHTGASILK
jgi:hypothetical protein